MQIGLIFLTGLTLLAVVGVLILGLVSLAKGEAFSKKYGNKLMQARIVLQLVAVGLLVLGAMLWGH
ncbi:MAG: twin transmembrane helix small protein [Alphaproteobacteria bacterium]|nr:twin transmembrane helix small protein [Alphaproteobacteria bacterium]